MDNSSALTYSQTGEELLSSLDLARFSRKNRTKSDFTVVYDLAKKAECQMQNGSKESTCIGSSDWDDDEDRLLSDSDEDCMDENALEEDGLSDGEFDAGKGAKSERPRFDTYDEYSKVLSSKCGVSPSFAVTPVQQMPTTSEQVPAGLVAATPSNPVMFVYCALPSQSMTSATLGQPYPYFGQMASVSSMVSPVATMGSMQSITVSAEPSFTAPLGEFLSVRNASDTATATPLAEGKKSPPGSWSVAAPEGSAKQISAERTKGSGRHNKKKESSRTTVMLQNLPSYFSRDMVLGLLESLGYAHKYDFVHMPADVVRLSCLGFAFVNMRTHEDALQFSKDADGFKDWPRPSNKIMSVSWSNPLQGLHAQIQRYRNATCMHPSVPEQCKPLLFGKDGAQLPFPQPTTKIKAPRSN